MNILILGGTGFIGSHLAKQLSKEHRVVCTSRKPSTNAHIVTWDGANIFALMKHLKQAEVVINLIGENIGTKKWTNQRKEEILQSRIQATKALSSAIAMLQKDKAPTPHTIMQASAIGYYGLYDNFLAAPFCDEKSPKGSGFLADTCEQWENSIQSEAFENTKLLILRFAPVVGKNSNNKIAGFLAPMVLPYKFYLGGVFGSGKQPISIIHIQDLCNAIEFLLHNNANSGIYNICCPESISMESFVSILSKCLNKPIFIKIPNQVVKFILGEMGEELILNGQKARANNLKNLNFEFTHSTINSALADILKK